MRGILLGVAAGIAVFSAGPASAAAAPSFFRPAPKLIPSFLNYFSILSDSKETAGIEYHSQLEGNNFAELTANSQDKDRILQYTSVGIHKDDLTYKLNNYAVKKFGSQGQQKSFLSAIKLAQYEILKTKKNIKPVLLLDDIFDKLDDHRVERLMQVISSNDFGQIFLTDTHSDRSSDLFKKVDIHPKIFSIEAGHAE